MRSRESNREPFRLTSRQPQSFVTGVAGGEQQRTSGLTIRDSRGMASALGIPAWPEFESGRYRGRAY